MASVVLTTTSGETTVNVSALSYAKTCLDAPAANDEKNAMLAFYNYYKAAAAYAAA